MTYKEQQAAFEAIKSLYRDEPRDKGTSFREVVNSLKNVVNANRRDIGASYLKLHYQYFVFDCISFALDCTKQPTDVVFDTMEELLIKKGNDYANKDRLSNFARTAELVGQTSGQSCLSAIGTKIARLEQLFASGKPPENESVTDSIIDLCNYSFLLYCIIIDKP